MFAIGKVKTADKTHLFCFKVDYQGLCAIESAAFKENPGVEKVVSVKDFTPKACLLDSFDDLDMPAFSMFKKIPYDRTFFVTDGTGVLEKALDRYIQGNHPNSLAEITFCPQKPYTYNLNIGPTKIKSPAIYHFDLHYELCHDGRTPASINISDAILNLDFCNDCKSFAKIEDEKCPVCEKQIELENEGSHYEVVEEWLEKQPYALKKVIERYFKEDKGDEDSSFMNYVWDNYIEIALIDTAHRELGLL